MDTTAEDGIHAQLVSLTEAHLRSQVIVTCRIICVLLIRAVTVRLVRFADVCDKSNSEELDYLLGRGGSYLRSHRGNDGVEQVLEPPECRVVLQNLALGIENIPGVDLNRQYNAEADEIEGDYSCGGCYVLIGRKVHDGVIYRHSEQCAGIGVQRELREKPKEIFGVQLRSIKGPSDVYAALDLSVR